MYIEKVIIIKHRSTGKVIDRKDVMGKTKKQIETEQDRLAEIFDKKDFLIYRVETKYKR